MNRAGQRGVALISVLLITSLALLVVGGLLRSHRLALKSTAQQIHQLHLKQVALAAEGWAAQQLQSADLDAGNAVHPGQAWHQDSRGFTLADQQVQVAIEDLGGRFNMAPLLVSGDVDETAKQRWFRLLDSLDIPAFELSSLKGIKLTDTSQLRLIPSLKDRDLQRMLPLVTVLAPNTPLNINTASAQVLASLEGLSFSSARAVVAQRPAQGYSDVQAFTRSPILDGLGISSHGLGVSSRWFRVTVDVSLGDRRLRLVSDLERVAHTRRVRVLQRRLLAPTESITDEQLAIPQA